MSSYFTLPSFARAKKNKEALEKTNPTEPVLKDEDEKFLTKITSQEAHAPEGAEEVAPTKITDDGKEVEVSKEDAKVEGKTGSDQVAVPETKPEETTGGAEESNAGAEKAKTTPEESKAEERMEKETPSTESVDESKTQSTNTAEDPPEQVPEVSAEKPQLERKKSKRNKGFDLPSQEEAEAATKGFNSSEAQQAQGADNKTTGEKRTWASYLPNVRKGAKTDAATEEKKDEQSEKRAEESEGKDATTKEAETPDEPMSRSWVQYASFIIPPASSLPSLPSLPASWTRGKDATSEPILNEDGTINEAATKEQQEKEVSVLLDNLSLSSINNRVFSFSAESQKYYDRFTQVLKDVMTGAPTAYEDMDKLMKDAGPTLEKHFESMPPFVQTLVKSLPAKLGTTLGPELLAAASEKPGNDLKTRMEATNKSKSGDASIEPAAAEGEKSKKKRKIPGLKGLISEQGMVASILRNIVNFLRVRFPFVIGTTNVVMSLAVFILMFVFWYCHKRGKEVRLEKEHEAAALKDGSAEGAVDGAIEEDDDEIEVSDSEEEEEGEGSADALAEKIAQGVKDDTAAESAHGESEKQDVLNKPEPAQVPLPDTEKGEKGAGLEEAKSVGV